MEVVYLKDEETGKETWTYGEWVVRLYSWTIHPEVECPDRDVDIDVSFGDDGPELYVKGERHNGGYDGYSAVPISIPFKVLEAIIDATAKADRRARFENDL